MPLRAEEQFAFVLAKVVAWMSEATTPEQGSYSQIMEFAVRELVQETMRVLALESESGARGELLNDAIEKVEERVQAKLPITVRFSTEEYQASLRNGLRFPAREISDLANRLRQSDWQEHPEYREGHHSQDGVLFRIITVGQAGAVEALIAQPFVPFVELEIDRIREMYEVEGKYFPFQVKIGELQFVIDDDGQIYTCTKNFPEGLLEQAKVGVKALAYQVYQKAPEYRIGVNV